MSTVRVAACQEQIDENPELFEWFRHQYNTNFHSDFIDSLGHWFYTREKPLTERQLAALERRWKRDQVRQRQLEERLNTLNPFTGPIKFVGKVKVTKAEWRYGGYGEYLSITTEVVDGPHEGCKIWFRGTQSVGRPEVGDEFTVKVSIEPHIEDPSFAFGKRAVRL